MASEIKKGSYLILVIILTAIFIILALQVKAISCAVIIFIMGAIVVKYIYDEEFSRKMDKYF